MLTSRNYYTISILIFLPDFALMITSAGTFYQKVDIPNSKQWQHKESIAQKYFHACSINFQCNYVVKERKKQVKLYNALSDLPDEENLLRIWVKKRRYHYKLFTQKRNWKGAREVCQSHNGDLASILNKEEETKVGKLLPDPKNVKDVWFGLNDIETEGKFVWSDGLELLYTNWGEREPNGYERENCTMIRGSMQWYDVTCDYEISFVCKIPLI